VVKVVKFNVGIWGRIHNILFYLQLADWPNKLGRLLV
jgi:hypothetical protein